MITAKEKAIELVGSFRKHARSIHSGFLVSNEDPVHESSKKCALIAVDEILNNFGLKSDGVIFYTGFETIEFYNQVKEEINKL